MGPENKAEIGAQHVVMLWLLNRLMCQDLPAVKLSQYSPMSALAEKHAAAMCAYVITTAPVFH